ncbi:hypothetical protein SAMN05518672_102236 [Chitinophaga sp. CF118]|nr:hypothetical protein SAMN05518672_102236 [Chitinophaga sp. CF118]
MKYKKRVYFNVSEVHPLFSENIFQMIVNQLILKTG